MLKETL